MFSTHKIVPSRGQKSMPCCIIMRSKSLEIADSRPFVLFKPKVLVLFKVYPRFFGGRTIVLCGKRLTTGRLVCPDDLASKTMRGLAADISLERFESHCFCKFLDGHGASG